jgi:predicted acylesterase/phospholipase RssA
MTGASTRDSAARAFEEISRRAADLRAELQRAIDILLHGKVAPRDDETTGAVVDVDTLELTVRGWRHLLPADPVIRRTVAELVVARFGSALARCPQLVATMELRSIEFGGAAPEDATVEGGDERDPRSLEDALERVDLPGGATLFERGEVGDSLYVITRGRLRLVLDGDGDESMVRELGPDQTVGETALLTGDVRRGTVVAIRDSVLYRLGREDFERFAMTHPTATHSILATLAQRLNRPPVRGRAAVVPTNIAVLPAGRDAPVRAFADAFSRFMADYASTTLVTAGLVEDAIGEGAIDADPASRLGVRVHDHLSALEERYEHVISLSEDVTSPWSVKCAREADLIVLVGRAGASPELNPLEERLFDSSQAISRSRVQLVLVETHAETTPVGTAAWLERREVEVCHHLHLEWRSHFARLARFVVGAPVGLVLSGGAARAFAHVGVLRALRDAGIPIDIICATSAGALIGGQFAMGWSPERIVQVDHEIFGRSRRKLLDLVPPFTSLIGSTRFNSVLDEIFAGIRIEDLWIQFMCTTTDLTSAQGCTHRQGPLRLFVRASCSLPMVMPPVTHHGHLLADGGIMNGVPVDPLLAVSNVGTLIVVNVTNPFYSADEAYNYDDSLPLRRVLNSRLNPFADKLVAPGIFDVLMRSLEIGSKSLEPAQIAKADIYVRPDVAGFGYTDVMYMADIVAAGHRAATARLAELGTPNIPFAGPPR